MYLLANRGPGFLEAIVAVASRSITIKRTSQTNENFLEAISFYYVEYKTMSKMCIYRPFYGLQPQ